MVTVVVAVPVVGTMVAEATGTWGRVVAMETWPQVALEIRILNVVGRMGEIDCSSSCASNHTCGWCSLLPYA